jgi:hypothetical protein
MRTERQRSKPRLQRAAKAPQRPPRACVEELSVTKWWKALDVWRVAALSLCGARRDARQAEQSALTIPTLGTPPWEPRAELAIPYSER